MKRLNTIDNTHLKLLLYGRPGSGKTRAAATAALDERTAPVLHLDIGGNTLSVRDYPFQPDILQLDRFAELDLVYDFLTTKEPATHQLLRKFDLKPRYRTVIIDGVSELQRDAFMDETGNRGKGPGARLAARQIQHYGAVMAQMAYMAYSFYKLPMNVIITALEKEDHTSSGGVFYRPMLDGQAAGMVASYAYSTIRMMPLSRMTPKQLEILKRNGHEIADTDYSIAMLRPSSDYDAKDQSGIGSPYMVSPSVTKMLDAIARNSVTPQPYTFTADDRAGLDIMTGAAEPDDEG